ncbi:MAG: DUF3102 domain-containing protein [Clostridia bacterium]|nr:DUF3102 domain-containing protein [Clostridia bacterium]
MKELSTPTGGGVSVIEDLARQARYFAEGAASNMLQLGRVLCEAKELIDHGSWEGWVKDNAGVDLRAAQYFMSSYKKYGADSPLAKLGPSKLFALLPMSEEEIQQMDAEKPLDSRSVREIKEAVKKARAEEKERYEKALADQAEKSRISFETLQTSQLLELQRQKEAAERKLQAALAEAEREKATAIERAKEDAKDENKALLDVATAALEKADREKEEALTAQKEQLDAAEAALARADEEKEEALTAQRMRQDAVIAEMREEIAAKERAIAELQEAQSQMQEMTRAAIEGNKDIQTASAEAERKVRALEDEIREKDEAIQDLQEGYNQMQEELLNAQSQIAKGDAGRSNGEILSGAAVMDAINSLMNCVGRVPYMHGAFATMAEEEREIYRHGILMVKDWAEKSLNAVEAVDGSGVQIV